MGGKIITVIGRPQQGKTPYCSTLIEDKNCRVYDVNNEYGSLPFIDLKKSVILPKRARYFGNPDTFITLCLAVKNTVCLFEDAGGFLGYNTEQRLRSMVGNRGHTGNYYVFLFWDFGSLPNFIRNLTDYFIIFKTTDVEEKVIEKAPQLLESFLEVSDLPDYYFIEFDNMKRKSSVNSLYKMFNTDVIGDQKRKY